MLKQFTILGIVLLIAGGIGLVRTLPYHSEWAALGVAPKAALLTKPREGASLVQVWPVKPHDGPGDFNDELVQLRGVSQETLRTQQQARLQADIDRLAGGEKPDPGTADMLYGPNWQEQVAQYKTTKERNESILTGSFVLALVGLTVFTCCLLVGAAKLVLHIARWVAAKIEAAFKRPRPAEPAAAEPAAQESPVHVEEDTQRLKMGPAERQRGKIAVDVSPVQAAESMTYQRTYPSAGYDEGEVVGVASWMADANMEHLLSDEQSRAAASIHTVEPVEREPASKPTGKSAGKPEATPKPAPTPSASEIPEAAASDVAGEATELKESLAAQTADLERQVAEFKAMVQSAPRTDANPQEPFNQTLSQLNDHISAIRQYAADQQRQVEKLQGGYDWTIIRTFCLRVIRCVDNLEDRIARLAEEDEETSDHLNQVRDELLFALESSGVEPFEPEVNSVFQGQERWAEAIKEKEAYDVPRLKGCVAAVIKPGYQYVVDDQNMKVVRAARVKLYG
jgi:molecular chaperone GrpE (heat shock protein)